ncbi:MAG: NfeD family protein [Bacteroidales bacterium]|jgi:membrane-bound ClpP family serine protease|nr:NfeD family protein [Bacteroidales bacterium]
MSLGLIIFFILLGILLFVVEFMLIPGVTVAGIAGAIFVIGGIVLSFTEHGAAAGFGVLIGTSLLLAIVVTLMLRAGTWKKLMLTTAIDSKVDMVHKEEGKVKAGDRGLTVTRLNPMGKVMVNGDFYEARALDILIDQRSEIEVVEVEVNRLIVKPIKK